MVETALQIVDEAGADALSMRSLAQRLNSSTATLYRHFPNRAALAVAVIDRVLGEIASLSGKLPDADWREMVHTMANDYFAALTRHLGVAKLLADHTPAGPNAMALREFWLASMLNKGFPVELAVRVGALVASYVQGFAIQLAGQRVAEELDDGALAAAIGRLDPAEFPALMIAWKSGAAPVPLVDEFAFGLELILDGLGAVLDASRD
jgi:TetR/AcrR family tetracycline transcriptional repressor